MRELPHKPFVVIGADYHQVGPIKSGTISQFHCDNIFTIELTVVHPTGYQTLLKFLETVRKKQPSTCMLRNVFGDRLLRVFLKKPSDLVILYKKKSVRISCGYASRTNAFGM